MIRRYASGYFLALALGSCSLQVVIASRLGYAAVSSSPPAAGSKGTTVGSCLLQAKNLTAVAKAPAPTPSWRRVLAGRGSAAGSGCGSHAGVPCSSRRLLLGIGAHPGKDSVKAKGDGSGGIDGLSELSPIRQLSRKGDQSPPLGSALEPNLAPYRHMLPEPYYRDVPEDIGLLVEMHLPGWSLEALHKSAYDSLANFMLALHSGLTEAVEVGPRRISIIGITGRYQRAASGIARDGEEVVVKFQITRAEGPHDPTPEEVLKDIRHKLSSSAEPKNPLLLDPLGALLKNATLSRSFISGSSSVSAQQRRTVERMSAMALPIGISAAFTGILIWLAAW